MLKPALAYVLPVFAVAFVLGAFSVGLVAPTTGPLLAVVLELPLVLALSWVVAGRVLNRWPRTPRLGMGLLSFLILMLLELATALAPPPAAASLTLADLARMMECDDDRPDR